MSISTMYRAASLSSNKIGRVTAIRTRATTPHKAAVKIAITNTSASINPKLTTRMYQDRLRRHSSASQVAERQNRLNIVKTSANLQPSVSSRLLWTRWSRARY